MESVKQDSDDVKVAVHTPGPWTLTTVKTQVGLCHRIGEFPSGREHRPITYGCVYEDGIHLWRVFDNGTHDSELLANARLMAAAPDMLIALKETLNYWDSCGFSDCDEGCECIVQSVQAAIAKAEGRQ